MSISFAWYERATLAQRLVLHHPAFETISHLLYAARLDALLEGTLASIELDLISKNEEKMIWWWIAQVCHARVALPLAESWESAWARAWEAIARGMLVSLPPPPMIPRQQFDLRFKWALKVPKIDGVPVQGSIHPSYQAWIEASTEDTVSLCQSSSVR